MKKNFDGYDESDLESYLKLPKGALANIPIYARVPAIEAIQKVRTMEATSQFRPGLYYIVLADLRGNTAFNAKYGNEAGNVRTEWFHTTVVQTIGELDLKNYVAFSKTVGDASLLIFSSFADVYSWSRKLTGNLHTMSEEYWGYLEDREDDLEFEDMKKEVADFHLRARRLVHLGEVSYKEKIDPLSLAVSQTFKIEKEFDGDELGCTEAVHSVALPLARELRVSFKPHKDIEIAGVADPVKTYYVVPATPKPKMADRKRAK